MFWSASGLGVGLALWGRFGPSGGVFLLAVSGRCLFCGSFVCLCLVFVVLSRLFIAALWSSAGKGLASWLSFVMFNYVFVTFPCGILGQVWYLVVSIPDHCHLSYFYNCRSVPYRYKIDIAINR